MAKSVLSQRDEAAKKRKKITEAPKQDELAWCVPGYEDALEMTSTSKGQSGQEAFRRFLNEEGF